MRFNRLWLLLLIGSLFYATNVYAGCCGYVSGSFLGTCQPSTEAQCTGLNSNNFYDPGTCPVAPQCDTGCCCINVAGVWTGTGDYINHACNFFGGEFYSGQPAGTCEEFCTTGQNIPNYTLSGYAKIPLSTNNSGIFVNLTNRLGKSSFTQNNLGYYVFANVRAGDVQISAKKDECSYNGMVTLNSNREFNFTLTCCQYSCQTGECINGQQTTNCTALNASICSNPSYSYNSTCAINLCPWQCSAWVPAGEPNTPCPAPFTQRTRTCNQINNGTCVMGGTSPDQIGSCYGVVSSCGNGILEGLEQCDFISSSVGNSTCNGPYNTYDWCNLGTGANACTCKYPEPTNDCEENPNYPVQIQLSHIYKKNWTNASWYEPIRWTGGNNSCAVYVQSYKLWICNNASRGCGNISSGYTQITIPELPSNVLFKLYKGEIIKLDPNTEYCYFLTTTFNQSIIGNKVRNSGISCITTGDVDCLKDPPAPDKWCGTWPISGGVSSILTCNMENRVAAEKCIDTAGPGSYCTMVGNSPGCVVSSQCERCNGLFGIFGYQGYGITIDDTGNGNKLLCPGPSVNDIKAYYDTTPSIFAGCYLDYSITSVDYTYSCNATSTCYDYKSRKTCESDPCSRFNYTVGQSLCEWEDYSVVFKNGVCRPKREYVEQGTVAQNCTLCTIPSYNRMYGGCTDDTCGLYGYCQYQQSTGECIDGFDLSCSEYENEEDCIGGVNVSVDTRWGFVAGQWTKIGGTNMLLRNSSDILQIKRCEWNGTKCFRNADNLSDTVGDEGRDCVIENSSKEVKCERDIIPSLINITTKKHYGRYVDLNNKIYVTDNENWLLGDPTTESLSERDNTWVYYCIGENPSCYPRLNFMVTGTNAYKIPTRVGREENGLNYYVNYFTEDPGKNLGRIYSFNFTVDSLPPSILFEYSMNSYSDPDNTSRWLTNLFVQLKLVSESSLNVTCTYNMSPTNNPYMLENWDEYLKYEIPSPFPPQRNVMSSVPGELNTTFFLLRDDNYDYVVSCFDDAGNEYKQAGTIRIEGDITISGPNPLQGTFTSDTLPSRISINTTANGTCKYSQFTTNYSNMINSYFRTPISANQFVHTAGMIEVFPELETQGIIDSKIYKIYTACNLSINGQYNIITGDYADIIRFAVDDLPPKTRIEYDLYPADPENEWLNFTNNHTVPRLNLRLINNDNDARLINPDNNVSMAFGPNKTFYCITQRMGVCTPTNYTSYDFIEGLPIILDYTEQYGPNQTQYGIYPKLCVYSVDNGNNQEQENCMMLRISNTVFDAPNITIIST